jgi:hypothetical protein
MKRLVAVLALWLSAACCAQAQVAPANGYWWNPAESGRGFVIEVQGTQLFIAGFLYASSGESTWVASIGPMTSPSRYSGPLITFSGGQTLTGAYNGLPTPGAPIGTISLAFTSNNAGTLTWPGGTIPIQRFDIVPGGSATAQPATNPQTGYWWNSSESGRGFTVEVQNGVMYLAAYMYDAAGNPVWYLASGAMSDPAVFEGEWTQYSNGQTLGGSYQAPALSNANVGPVTLQFADNANATLTLPDGREIPFQRFIFGGGSGAAPAAGAWLEFGRDSQHSAQGTVAAQPLTAIQWSTPIDLVPQYTYGELTIHYGSPMISAANTVLVPVKAGASGSFRVDARTAGTGSLLWSATSDYVLPPQPGAPFPWTPVYGPALTAANRLYFAGSGGKIYYRDNVDSTSGTVNTLVFYGLATYQAASSMYDNTVYIDTPLTTDAQGNLFFGFYVGGQNGAGLTGGIARIGADGTGSWASAATLAGDAGVAKVALNAAPALSPDQQTLYVAVNDEPNQDPTGQGLQYGYLLALDATTLAVKGKQLLIDPHSLQKAFVSDESSASPTTGPDGDVYYGVLESTIPQHNDRGWMMHFSANLAAAKTPGSFGWDDTPSIVPAGMVPSYKGSSSYLIVTKYNNYAGQGTGNGLNRVAVLDPNATESDLYSGIPVMNEVLTVLGVTADPQNPGGVKEWCINSAAVDPLTNSIFVNSEDGLLYRWNLITNTLSQRIQITGGLGQAYTSTLIGPDGTVYAVNNATLFAVGR